jgi:NAD(P)-dependent dehydrogenase (short-subunit alcohol dehydrogenase family)
MSGRTIQGDRMYDLSGRVAVITGGNGGIGLGIARALADAGADISVWGRNEEKNAAALESLTASGRSVSAEVCDVAEEDQVLAAFASTLERHGKVDVMVANAGMGLPGPIHTLPLGRWQKVMAVNLDGAFLTLREAARHMIERGEGGALVATGSVSAIQGAPGNQAYSSSKAALGSLIRGMAVELARHRIRANLLMPGWTDSDMTAPLKGWDTFVETTTKRTPARRWGTPEDMGRAAVFLSDPSFVFHTGDTVVVDGGYSIF